MNATLAFWCGRDDDTIRDLDDTCPDDYDPNNVDRDADGIGDLCDNCVDVPMPTK